MNRGSDSEAVASPCISVCVIDPVTGLCGGCFRTLNEIAGWIDFSIAEKHDVIGSLPGRRSIFGAAIDARMEKGMEQPVEQTMEQPMDESAER
jgi:predicted Fe-S protein YdhL (DUF1289 family)